MPTAGTSPLACRASAPMANKSLWSVFMQPGSDGTLYAMTLACSVFPDQREMECVGRMSWVKDERGDL